jgi:hypothetical protein
VDHKVHPFLSFEIGQPVKRTLQDYHDRLLVLLQPEQIDGWLSGAIGKERLVPALRWADVDLDAGRLHVRQRADRFNEIGKPKSESGDRTIPLGPLALNTLKEWKLACPKAGILGHIFIRKQ